MYVINKILAWRTEEKDKLHKGADFGQVTSVNLTILNGGSQLNVVPSDFSAGFDVREAVNADHRAIEDTINKWCQESGENVRIVTVDKNEPVTPVKLDDSNSWWLKFKGECDKM